MIESEDNDTNQDNQDNYNIDTNGNFTENEVFLDQDQHPEDEEEEESPPAYQYRENIYTDLYNDILNNDMVNDNDSVNNNDSANNNDTVNNNDSANNFENDTITNNIRNIRRRNSSANYLVSNSNSNSNNDEQNQRRNQNLLEINIENINRTINSNSQVSEDEYECTICNENFNEYYRICNCNPDIILCEGCIRNLEYHQFMECPFCRNRLQITQYKKRIPNHKEIHKILLLLLVIFLCEIMMPIILISIKGELDNSENNHFVSVTNTPTFLYVLSFISVLIIKPINILLFNLTVNNIYNLNVETNYFINYFISIGIGLIYMIMMMTRSSVIYHEIFLVVIIPFYLIPLILLILSLLYINISYICQNIFPLNTINRITPIDSFYLDGQEERDNQIETNRQNHRDNHRQNHRDNHRQRERISGPITNQNYITIDTSHSDNNQNESQI